MKETKIEKVLSDNSVNELVAAWVVGILFVVLITNSASSSSSDPTNSSMI